MCRGRTCTSLILFTVAKVAQFSIRSRGAVGFPPAIRLSPFGEPKCQAGSIWFLRSRCRRIEGDERLICSDASCKTDRLIRRCRSRYKEKSWEVSEEARQGLFCRRTKYSNTLPFDRRNFAPSLRAVSFVFAGSLHLFLR